MVFIAVVIEWSTYLKRSVSDAQLTGLIQLSYFFIVLKVVLLMNFIIAEVKKAE